MDMTEDTIIPENGLKQHYEVLKELGDCYASVGRLQQAGECYERGANLAPDEPGPYVGLGVIAIQQNRLDDAEVAFKVARRLNARCAEAYCGLGMVFQQRQDFQQAFDLYLKCLELDTDNLTALLGLFQTSCRMGSFEKIIHYLKVYLDMHPGDTAVMFCLATLYAREGKFTQAEQMLSDVLLFDQNNKDAAGLLEEVRNKLAEVN